MNEKQTEHDHIPMLNAMSNASNTKTAKMEYSIPTPIPMEEYIKDMEILEMRCIPVGDAKTITHYVATKGMPTPDDVEMSLTLVDHAQIEHRGKPLVVILHPDPEDAPEE